MLTLELKESIIGKETLLIVEDNDALREGLREMLNLEGFSILAAANGRAALEQMAIVTPDLIVSDISMPEMDGIAFFSAVRARPEWLTIPFLFLTARGEKQDILRGKYLGAEDYLVKPLTRDELITAVRSRLKRSEQLRMAQLRRAYEASLTALANAIDIRDRYTRGHVERVTAYTLAMARKLNWPEKDLDILRFGAILHDIGKIHIPENILFKVTPVTAAEWQEIKRHPVNGAEMIKDIPYLSPAVPIIRYHHERWNGQGYPEGLTGEEIPLGARIVAVADSFDAMTTQRPYSPARTLEDALQEILNCAGNSYDPAVVEVFQSLWNESQIRQISALWKYNS